MMEHQDLPLELVATLRLQGWADHHHALPDLRPFYFLQGETRSLAALHFSHRHSLTMYRPDIGNGGQHIIGRQIIDFAHLTAMGWKCPRGSGPSRRVSLTRIVPLKVVPLTTVPTPGTW